MNRWAMTVRRREHVALVIKQITRWREEETVKSTIWLSYDLGVNGDYEGMYAWLDNHGAKECGSSVAYLKFSHDGDLPASLQSDIESVVALNKRSRVYVIYKKGGKMSGRYLIGHRRGAPWEGFGDKDETEEDLDDTQ